MRSQNEHGSQSRSERNEGSGHQGDLRRDDCWFQSAAHDIVYRVAREKLEQDETFQAKMSDLFKDVVTKLFSEPVREALVEKISKAVLDNLKPRDY